jgi:hypothetical protein
MTTKSDAGKLSVGNKWSRISYQGATFEWAIIDNVKYVLK